MFVFLNDRLVAEKAAKVSVFDPGFTAGEGVFETVILKHGVPQFLREHFRRLTAGAQVLGIKLPTFDFLQNAVTALAAKNKLSHARAVLRITATPETFLLTTRPFPAERPATASALFVSAERCLPHIKSLNYLPTVLAQRTAARAGFDEALLVNSRGFVTEGGRTNLFFVQKNRLFTPPLEGALAGVTHGKVCQLATKLGFTVTEKCVTPAELLAADELFLTNAVMEVWPVTRLDGKKFAVGELTQKLAEAYRKKYD